MARVQQLTRPAEWNAALAPLANPHVLQTWEWGEIKARHGWTPSRLLILRDGAVAGAAQVLRRPLSGTPFGVLYVPKGPAFADDSPDTLHCVLDALQEYARHERAIFIKIDPDLALDGPAPALLAAQGWQPSRDQIQFRNTVLLDLARPEQEILVGMKSKWRYNIRLAERKGVEVISGGEGAVEQFYELYAETSARDGFLIRPLDYYRHVWGTMVGAGRAEMLLARYEGQFIAGLVLFLFARRAWYFYGASRSSHRDLMPNHLLQWRAIQHARARDCTVYDFWGAPNTLDEADPMYGVYKFKLGFGGDPAQWIGAYDYISSPALHALYKLVYPRYLSYLRSRGGAPAGQGLGADV
jgi:lipid II:glycine glycyltransferase (peptidoglycan interpeptide bridge formation enzyme)